MKAWRLTLTKLTQAQQSEISDYVAALINQIRAKFGLTAWIYNDMTLAQALAIVNYAIIAKTGIPVSSYRKSLLKTKQLKPKTKLPKQMSRSRWLIVRTLMILIRFLITLSTSIMTPATRLRPAGKILVLFQTRIQTLLPRWLRPWAI